MGTAKTTMTKSEHMARYEALLGVVIRTARFYRSMDAEVLAEACGVGPETVARWERGETTVPSSALAVIYATLTLPADLLLSPPGSRPETLARIAAYDVHRQRTGGPPAAP